MNNGDLIRKCINTLSDIRKENILDSNLNNKIDNVIYEVKELENNKNIKLAVLGEFSAGKSTFINALMRNEILSYADEPTTAINTYITYGEKEIIKIIKNNGKIKFINKLDIEEYTKESKNISDINKVIIECNNEYLKSGLTIIDTPGANFESKRHKQRRSEAIKEAVVGIFLIGINSLTSKSFIDFLISNKDNMGKIIFVINKCDILEDDDINIDFKEGDKINNIYSYVKENIIKYTGKKDIDIYMISSKYFLENKNCKVINVKKSFNKLEDKIKEIYIKEKLTLIYWKIFNILKQINEEINAILKDKQAIGEYELNKTNSEIKSIDQFIDDEFNVRNKNVKNRLKDYKRTYKKDIKLIREEYMEKFSNKIDSIKTMSSFKNNIRSIYEEEINSYIYAVESEVNNVTNEVINNELNSVENSYFKYFDNLKKVYKILGIEKRQKIKESFYYIITIFIPFILTNIVKNYINMISENLYAYINWNIIPYIIVIISLFILRKDINESKIIYYIKVNNTVRSSRDERVVIPTENLNGFTIGSGSGAGIGAIIGTFAGGPIGAAIGAGIGGIVGSLFAASKLSDLKNEYSIYFNDELEKIETEIDKYINNIIEKKYNLFIDNYKLYAAENMILYSELIDGIYKFNTSKINRLINSNNVFKHYLKKINLLNKEINKVTSNLNSKVNI